MLRWHQRPDAANADQPRRAQCARLSRRDLGYLQGIDARAALSSDYPALQALKTRDNDDFTVAFLDATSVVLDILTFYQERLVNESYLRTASQVQSLTELARLVGYQPAPGVAASTYLAFSLRAATGQPPDPSAAPITIPAGTQVQSVPAPGQKPQTFETSADIPAKPDWNALPVRTGSPWMPATNDTSVYLAGTATQLQPGDLFLVVGDERVSSNTNENWDVRAVATVTVDGPNKRTLVTWNEGLGGGGVSPASLHPKFYAFRQRAALFGYNALQPVFLSSAQLAYFNTTLKLLNSAGTDWDFSNSQSSANKDLYKSQLIDLDGIYSKIVPHGWIALIVPDAENTRSPAGLVTLYRVNSITTISRSDFGIGAKLSRVAADLGGTNLQNSYSATRATSALVQSELLTVPEQPLNYPLYGTFLELEGLRPDLAGVTAVALSGKAQKVAVADGVDGLIFYPGDGSTPMAKSGRHLNPRRSRIAAIERERVDHRRPMAAGRWHADFECRRRGGPARHGRGLIERLRSRTRKRKRSTDGRIRAGRLGQHRSESLSAHLHPTAREPDQLL